MDSVIKSRNDSAGPDTVIHPSLLDMGGKENHGMITKEDILSFRGVECRIQSFDFNALS